MGAYSVEFVFPGKLTKQQVLDKFKKECVKLDKKYHTENDYARYVDLGTIKFGNDMIEDQDEARRYCLEHAEKWEYCYGVKTKYKKPGGKRATESWIVCGWMPE